MDYPRLLKLDDDTKTRLASYVEQELLNHYGERSAWVQDLTDLQKEYFAEPSPTAKTFPFKGAANLVIPLIAIVVEAQHAKAMTTLFALEDFAVVKVPGILEDINWGLSKYVNYELLENGADMRTFSDNTLLEMYKLGTCVGKAGYEKVVKTAVRTIGDEEQEFDIVTKQGAIADAVSLPNFLMPFSATDPQTAPWCGEEHLVTSYEFKTMCDGDFFDDDTWELLKGYYQNIQSQELSSASYLQAIQDLQDQSPVWPANVGFCELWMCFDIDKSGKQKEIVVYYHRLSRKIIGVRYNWNDNLRRPYRIGKMFNVEHRWAGIGAGHQSKVFQREITIQHRQRLDNATIANIRMFKINKMAGYGPGEPIFPGKLWFVDNMDDIESLEAGEVYPSSFNDEIQSLQYAQQRNGVNELNLGMPQSGTPGTASSDMARLQEGSRKWDYGMQNAKRFLTEISRDVIINSMQFGTRNIEIFDYIPDGPQVQAFIKQAPLSLIREQLLLNLTLVGQNENKIQDRASWTQITGFLTSYYTQMFQFAQQIGDKNLTMMLAKFIPSGATEAMQQLLQTFDIRNLDRIIPQQLILGFQPSIQNPAVLNSGLIQNGDESSGSPASGGDTGTSQPSSQQGNGNPGGSGY